MALQTYRAKRNFAVTPEPRGVNARGSGNQFVIQKHAARRLHYDLRLELDGVMKSWAVTRGPSLVPGEKRLAVEVEDHPIEYNAFEGTIPEGEYGGGTVMIWDRGTWEPEGDPHKALKKGHLAFTLAGKKLSGAWHLIRLRGKPGEKRTNWLLVKSHDEAAREAGDPDILEEKPLSVVTGRSIPEIAEGKKRVWHSNRSIEDNVKAGATKRKTSTSTKRAGAAEPAPRKRKATAATRTRSTRAPAAAKKAKAKTKKTKAKKSKLASGGAPLPDFVPPCLATVRETAPDDASWIHEIKFDGYRIQARLDHGDVRLLTRKGLDWKEKFPAIAEAIAGLPAEQALIDGEVISQTERGDSSFSQLQEDLSAGRDDRLAYFGFDLLHLNGHDLTEAPLIERKQVLQELVGGEENGPIRYSDHFEVPGSVLLKHARQMDLEGIISKRRDAPYRSGRGGDWLKIKCGNRQEFVVAGFAPSTADGSAIGALILSYYKDGKLLYAGRAGTGYTHKMARELWKRLQPLRRPKAPFDRVPDEETRARNAHWVEPRVVVEVAFHGWTHGDRVRQASFQGVREDKSPGEIVREKEAMPAAKQAATAARASTARAPAVKPTRPSKSSKATKSAKTAQSGDNAAAPYSVKLTNPDRVYWEDVGVTKQGLVDYYVGVWDWISPHIVGRPLSLLRCPDGAAAQCFFQKHASAGIDRTHLLLVKEPDGDHVITIDNLDGLISLAQAGVLEIHPRGSMADNMEMADRLIFDLDPGPGIVWDDIVTAAREVRQRLKDVKLESFLKNSGGKGLHVVLPIKPAPWDEAKEFTRRIAEQMSADDPARYTATVKKASRNKRIFVDYLRNSREATAVGAYSTRARPGAAVSTPLSWEELGSQTGADQFTVLKLPQRLARLRKDSWAEIGKLKQALPKPARR